MGVDAVPRRPRPRPRALFALVGVTGVVAAGLCVVAVLRLAQEDLGALGPSFWVITGLVVLCELRPVVASQYDPDGVNVSMAFVFAVLFCWGPWPALLAQAVSMVIGELVRRRQGWRVIFNAGQYVVCIALAWGVMWLCHVRPSLSHPLDVSGHLLPVMALSWLVYFVCNMAVVSLAITYLTGSTFREAFLDDFGFFAVTMFAVLALSPVVFVVARTSWVMLPLLLLPLYLVYKTASISLEMEHAAAHDALTGLANRSRLIDEATRALTTARNEGRLLALCLIDLDRFKEVNDTLGHQTGDKLLEIAATRLAGAVRDGDLVARLGGDEFAVLLTHVASGEEARETAGRLRAVLTEPFHLDGMMLQVEASIGVAMHPDDASDVPHLMRLADVAMYQAKEDCTGVELYQSERDVHSLGRLGLMGSLRSGIEGDQLEMVFQPKISLTDGDAIGVEALVRWRHPEHGLLAPDAFLDLAEHSGLMRQLTADVLTKSLRRTAMWWQQGLELPVSVNVSVRDLADVSFVGSLAEALAASGLPARALQLEITEHVLMADPARMTAALEALAGTGVDLSLDDFGTGYSSLVHLKRLPVSEIKIDRSFVSRMTTDSDDAAIVKSIVELAHALGLRAIAEGVEDEDTRDALTALHCDAAQGYLFSHPLSDEAIAPWLAAHTRAATPAVPALVLGSP
jgi:diguanylate cyclase (GGDEF)-like protein